MCSETTQDVERTTRLQFTREYGKRACHGRTYLMLVSATSALSQGTVMWARGTEADLDCCFMWARGSEADLDCCYLAKSTFPSIILIPELFSAWFSPVSAVFFFCYFCNKAFWIVTPICLFPISLAVRPVFNSALSSLIYLHRMQKKLVKVDLERLSTSRKILSFHMTQARPCHPYSYGVITGNTLTTQCGSDLKLTVVVVSSRRWTI